MIMLTDCEEMINDIVIEGKTVETEDMTWVTGQNDTPRDEMPPGNQFYSSLVKNISQNNIRF